LDAAEVAEAFRRFRAAQPSQGRARACRSLYAPDCRRTLRTGDRRGVNKATPALFAAANTPAKMVALGEAKVADYIKTIGLFRTKART